MKNYIHLLTSITLGTCVGLNLACPKVSALDINLNGGANLNFNPINNNKYSTQMKNFAPGNIPLNQVDLMPLATPPASSVVKSFAGNKIFADVVDKGTNSEKEMKDLQRKTGQLVGEAPAPVADDQEVKDSDIQDFLGSYYKYLRSEGLSSGSLPMVPTNISPPKSKSSIKQNTTSLNTDTKVPKPLLAKQEKLLISNTPSLAKDQASNSP